MAETRDELMERVESLERVVRSLMGGPDELNQPFRPVFLARSPGDDDAEDASASGFIEQTVNGGEVADYPGGRRSTTDGDAANLIEPGSAFAVIEVIDVDAGGNQVHRYVPIRSAGGVTIKLTSDCVGGGKYRGKRATGTIRPTVTQAAWEAADLTFPEEGVELPQDEDCYVVNWLEIGESTHSLTKDASARRVHVCFPYGTAPDGLPIYKTYAGGILDCTT